MTPVSGPSGRRLSPGALLWATAASLFFAVIVTWPQAVHIGTATVAHGDPLFSIWRISWIAHALATAPLRLLDANIFHPATRTLTFSDATLLEGVLAAPLLWARVPPTLVYNLLLVGGMAASGVAMFVLVRELTGRQGPALVAAAIFTMAPYRVEHIMHLELQWAMWIPLTFWALHRVVDAPSPRAGAQAGLFFALQAISCVYYSVFLAIAATALVAMLACDSPRRIGAALTALGIGAVVAGVLLAPYIWPYLRSAQALGPRDPIEIARYSAQAVSYFAAPPQNWIWGWTADRWGSAELRLYPGIVAVALAAGALVARPSRIVVMYAVIAVLAVELSFGTNGRLYPLLMHLGGLQGLRAPARFGIIVVCGVAVLAGFGVRALQDLAGSGRWRMAAVAVPLILVSIDYANTGTALASTDSPRRATLYRAMVALGRGVTVELPMPDPGALPGRDVDISYWSISHWFPLVNGYSGYYPPEYLRTIHEMRTFPDRPSLDRLHTLGVRYVVVHRSFYAEVELRALLLAMGKRPELHFEGNYTDPIGVADLYVLSQD